MRSRLHSMELTGQGATPGLFFFSFILPVVPQRLAVPFLLSHF
jgi:hypothetical protein